MQNHHVAALLGIGASAALYLVTGALVGVDWPDLAERVLYGIGMCVTAAGIAWRVYPMLARRRGQPER